MKILVNALFESLAAIMNVLVVILMVWVMFAILGMNLMRGKLGYCSVSGDSKFNPYNVGIDQCVNYYGGVWVNVQSTFDDIAQSLVTLFVVTTNEGWPNNLGWAMDANDPAVGPIYNNSILNGMYFCIFNLVSSIILINLLVGVIFLQFSEEQQKEITSKFYMVTEDQMRWMMVQDLIQNAKPNFDVMIRPKGRVRIFIFRLIQAKAFELTIMACIIGNIIAMSASYEGMSDNYSLVLDDINLAFTVVFMIEMTLKLIALDFQYFSSNWNNFDCSIVILSREF